MSKSVTMSFSVPIELSIKMEECIESEKFSRSEMIKKALELYLNIKESNKESYKLILETHNNVLEIKDLINNIEKRSAK